MRIFIANDDGLLAPGLVALIHVRQGLGEIAVFATKQNTSGGSNAPMLGRPPNIFTVRGAHSQDSGIAKGTLSEILHVALCGVLGYRPDSVLSRITDCVNLNDATLCTGHPTAAPGCSRPAGRDRQVMADLRRPPCRIARSEPAGQILILNVSKVPSISPTGAPALGQVPSLAGGGSGESWRSLP